MQVDKISLDRGTRECFSLFILLAHKITRMEPLLQGEELMAGLKLLD